MKYILTVFIVCLVGCGRSRFKVLQYENSKHQELITIVREVSTNKIVFAAFDWLGVATDKLIKAEYFYADSIADRLEKNLPINDSILFNIPNFIK